MNQNMTDSCVLMIPMDDGPGEVTQLLKRLAGGDKAAGNELAPHVSRELHQLAAAYLRRERSSHTWQTADLVQEAYVKLVADPDLNFLGRSHFFGIAAQIMRRLLTDYARKRAAGKRGANPMVLPLDDCLAIADDQCGLIADVDEALKRLEGIDPRKARVVELRFFGGLTEDEIAELMGISTRTVVRLWKMARAWLRLELSPGS